MKFKIEYDPHDWPWCWCVWGPGYLNMVGMYCWKWNAERNARKYARRKKPFSYIYEYEVKDETTPLN